MLGYLFYSIYIVLCIGCFFIVNSKNRIYVLYPLLFSAQFNVTAFLKVGVTVSFFELSLIFAVIAIIAFQIINRQNILNNIYLRKEDRIWWLFLVCSFISILTAFLRVLFDDLRPDGDIMPATYVRSFMSLNKFFFYFPCFIIIRSFLMTRYDEKTIKVHFLKAMAYSGVLPSMAILIQFSQIGFNLIHNNPSFSETFRIENYTSARPVGLTNEASFFVYQLFFSLLCLYYAWQAKIIKTNVYYFLVCLFISGVIVSISRTGLLIFALFYALIWLRNAKIFSIEGFFKLLKLLPLLVLFLILLTSLNIGGFNIGERFLSTFQQEADLSTLERYGSAEALARLLLDKSLILGVGIYNFQYYLKAYLPDYMNVFYYPRGSTPASFNFIFQIFVEFGVVLAVIFFIKARFYIYNNENDRVYKDWFLFLVIFSFSFQTLNFAIPFLIFLYPSIRLNENTISAR